MIKLFFLFALGFSLWIFATLNSKGKHHEAIKNELGNISESLKYLFSSAIALIKLMIKDSISSAKDEDFEPIKSNVIDLLKLEKKDKEEAA